MNRKESIGIIILCISLISTCYYLSSCSSDDDFNNVSNVELETNASSSMLLTEPSPIDFVKSTDNQNFSDYFDMGEGFITCYITYVISADRDCNNFRADTIAWNYGPLPMDYQFDKNYTSSFLRQNDNTIRVIMTFTTFRHFNSNDNPIQCSKKDTLILSETDFHYLH